jgi:hypothetical protein
MIVTRNKQQHPGCIFVFPNYSNPDFSLTNFNTPAYRSASYSIVLAQQEFSLARFKVLSEMIGVLTHGFC